MKKEWEERAPTEAAMAKWERALVAYEDKRPAVPDESFHWLLGEDVCLHEVAMYMDASMIDGLDRTLAALGLAFAAVKDGEVVAFARGVVPKYVRTIPAADTRALAMATMVVTGKARYFTDCKAVKLIAKSGMMRATSAAQRYARIWSLIFGHTDGETPWVEWIPAHLK